MARRRFQRYLQVGDGSVTSSLGSGDVLDDASLVFDCGGDIAIASAISGTGSVSQIGPDMLTLSGANSYNGGTTVSEGTLQVGNSGAVPGNTYTGNVEVDTNGTLDLNGQNITINGLSGLGTVTNNGSALSTFTVVHRTRRANSTA